MSDLLNKLNITDPDLIAQYHRRKDIVIYNDASNIIDWYSAFFDHIEGLSHIPILRMEAWMSHESKLIIHLSVRRVSAIFPKLNSKWVLEARNEIKEIERLVNEEKQLQTAFDGFEL